MASKARGCARMGPAAEVFGSLADPVRLSVLTLVSNGPAVTTATVAETLGEDPMLIAGTMRSMIDDGLLTGRPRYRLTDAGRVGVFLWLQLCAMQDAAARGHDIEAVTG